MANIGVIGCGLMGSGIVKSYLDNEDIVYVYDINQEAVGKLVEKGAISQDTPHQLSLHADYIIVSLPSPDLIKDLLIGESGIIYEMKPGTHVMDMSTNDVQYTREIHQCAEEKGVHFLDCPLSGGPEGANTGSLTIMVGGREEHYEAVLPILKTIGHTIQYIGGTGAGQVVKLCNNMVVAGIISLLSEALITGEKNGVSKKKIATLFQKGSAETKVMEVFGVNMLDDTFDNVKFSLNNLAKDVKLYHSLAQSEEAESILSKKVNDIVQHVSEAGVGNMDSSVIYDILKKTL